MRNLGGSKGASATELVSEILKHLTDRAIEKVKKDIVDAELNKLKDKAQKKIDEEKAKLQNKAKIRLEEKVKDKLKNLFGK